MATMVPAQNTNGPRLLSVNDSASSVITNTTTETAFNCPYTFPSQSQHSIQPVTLIRYKAYGIVSTGLLNLNMTVRARWGGISGTVLCSTGVFALGSLLSDAGWSMNGVLQINSTGASGSMEAQSYGAFNSGLLSISAVHMPATASTTIDTTVTNDLVITAQWGTAAAANQIQLLSYVVEVDGP